MLPRAGLSIEGGIPYTVAGTPDGGVRHCPECEGMTVKGLLSVVPGMLSVNAASGEEVFLSSPPHDITVTLEYTDPADPYGDQGYIETYRSVSYFSRVFFGPSISPVFAASFAAEVSPWAREGPCHRCRSRVRVRSSNSRSSRPGSPMTRR